VTPKYIADIAKRGRAFRWIPHWDAIETVARFASGDPCARYEPGIHPGGLWPWLQGKVRMGPDGRWL